VEDNNYFWIKEISSDSKLLLWCNLFWSIIWAAIVERLWMFVVSY